MHLAELGTAKGRPFVPDERMRAILARAAVMGHAQLAAQSFADRRSSSLIGTVGVGIPVGIYFAMASGPRSCSVR